MNTLELAATRVIEKALRNVAKNEEIRAKYLHLIEEIDKKTAEILVGKEQAEQVFKSAPVVSAPKRMTNAEFTAKMKEKYRKIGSIRWKFHAGSVSQNIVLLLRDGWLLPDERGIISVAAAREALEASGYCQIEEDYAFPYQATYQALHYICKEYNMEWNTWPNHAAGFYA